MSEKKLPGESQASKLPDGESLNVDDKTRVSPANKMRASSEIDERTVIKTAEKTRISPARRGKDSDSQVDALKNESTDKTRIAPQNRRIKKHGEMRDDDLNIEEKTRVSANHRAKRVPQRPSIPNKSGDVGLAAPIIPVDGTSDERIINNRFVIKESLGVGGMGMVFRALDLRKQETGDSEPYIAIKILSSEFEGHPQAFVSLQREAKKSQLISHPNVIKVYDFDRDGDLVYLTMEELKGQPLNQLIREYSQGLPLDMAINIIQAISEGLAYAHKKKIVHSDLKPDNIFYTEEGEVKIIDFGIARIITDLDAKGEQTHSFDDAEIVGLTPTYASLEMLQDEPATPSDDVYALGVISYELLTGEHPFSRESAEHAFEKKMSYNKVAKLKSYQWKAITKALLFEQKDRLKNGTEFRDIFIGKGRTARNLAVGLIIVSLIFVVSLFIPRSSNMDHLYHELTVEEQNAFNEYIHQGTVFLGFDDWNNAIALFEQAYEILPQHSTTQESLNNAVEKIIENMERATPKLNRQVKLGQIEQLLKYKSLTDNELLVNYKASIEGSN